MKLQRLYMTHMSSITGDRFSWQIFFQYLTHLS